MYNVDKILLLKDNDKKIESIKRLFLKKENDFDSLFDEVVLQCLNETQNKQKEFFFNEIFIFLISKTNKITIQTAVSLAIKLVFFISKTDFFSDKLFSLLSALFKRIVSIDNIELQTEERKIVSSFSIVKGFIQKLLSSKLNPNFFISFISLIKEIKADNHLIKETIQKILRNLSGIGVNDLPIIVYNILFLCQKEDIKKTVQQIVTHFIESERIYEQEVSGGRKKKVLGESVTIINFILNAKRDISIGRKAIETIQEDKNGFSCFSAGLLIGLTEIKTLQRQVFYCVKNMLLKEEDHERFSFSSKTKKIFKDVLRFYIVEGESLFGCYVDFGFSLLSIRNTEREDLLLSITEDLGIVMIVEAYQNYSFLRSKIQSKCFKLANECSESVYGVLWILEKIGNSNREESLNLIMEILSNFSLLSFSVVLKASFLLSEYSDVLDEGKINVLFMKIKKGLSGSFLSKRNAIELTFAFLSRAFKKEIREEAFEIISELSLYEQKKILLQRIIIRSSFESFQDISEMVSLYIEEYSEEIFSFYANLKDFIFNVFSEKKNNELDPIHLLISAMFIFDIKRKQIEEFLYLFQKIKEDEIYYLFSQLEEDVKVEVQIIFHLMIESLQDYISSTKKEINVIFHLQKIKNNIFENSWNFFDGLYISRTLFKQENVLYLFRMYFDSLKKKFKEKELFEETSLITDVLFFLSENIGKKFSFNEIIEILSVLCSTLTDYTFDYEKFLQRKKLRESSLFYLLNTINKCFKEIKFLKKEQCYEHVVSGLVEKLISLHWTIGCPEKNHKEGILIIELLSVLSMIDSNKLIESFFLETMEHKNTKIEYFKTVMLFFFKNDIRFSLHKRISKEIGNIYGFNSSKGNPLNEIEMTQSIQEEVPCFNLKNVNADILLLKLIFSIQERLKVFMKNKENFLFYSSSEDSLFVLCDIGQVLSNIVLSKIPNIHIHYVFKLVLRYLKASKRVLKKHENKYGKEEISKWFFIVGSLLKRNLFFFLSYIQKIPNIIKRKKKEIKIDIPRIVFEFEKFEEEAFEYGKKTNYSFSKCFSDNPIRGFQLKV